MLRKDLPAKLVQLHEDAVRDQIVTPCLRRNPMLAKRLPEVLARSNLTTLLGEQPDAGSRHDERPASAFRESPLDDQLALDEALCEPRSSHLLRCRFRPHE